MALLGVHGTVSFSREWGLPAAVDNSRLVSRPEGTVLDLGEPAFWSGDRVLILCQRGVPLLLAGGGAGQARALVTQDGKLITTLSGQVLTTLVQQDSAPCPGGYSFYGDGEFLGGPVGQQRQATGNTYIGGDGASFYDNMQSITSVYAYIHRDEMDDVTFYSSQDDAINGSGPSLIPLLKLDVGALVVLPAPDGSYEQSLVNQVISFAAPTIFFDQESEIAGDQFLPQSLSDQISTFLEDGSAINGWKQVANLTSWVFETNVDVLDQNAIGQKFGESAKGALRGAGSFNAIVDAKQNYEFFGPSSLLRLMLLTDVGAKANARFVIADSTSSENDCEQGKKIYYETPIIISNSTMDTSVTEIITMTIQFVATGKIRLALASEG